MTLSAFDNKLSNALERNKVSAYSALAESLRSNNPAANGTEISGTQANYSFQEIAFIMTSCILIPNDC